MPSLAWRTFGAIAFSVAVGSSLSCAGPGSYVWFNELPPNLAARNGDYVIAQGDILSVRVLGHEDMSGRVRVRADGRIAVAIIGEVDARGKLPSALRAELEARLKDYIVSPSVMLNVEETAPITITILGEVLRPGFYPIEARSGLAQAIALGGGLTEFAARDRIFVLRKDPALARIRFTYEAVSRNDPRAAAFALQQGDVVVVE